MVARMKGYSFILLVLFSVITAVQANEKIYSYRENNRLMFNIKAFNELKRQDKGSSNFEIQGSDGTILRYSENHQEYKELITTNNIYRVIHLFYKPSGLIKYESISFYGIPVNTIKHYDVQGEVIQEIVRTAPDWVERITQVAKQNFNVDLWTPFNAMLFKQKYQGREVIDLIHLNGKPLSLRTGDAIRNFALLDFVTLKVLLVGEIHQGGVDSSTLDPEPAIYMVNGKPISLDE